MFFDYNTDTQAFGRKKRRMRVGGMDGERDRKREKGKREKDKQKETNMRTMIQLFIFLGEGGSFSVVERKRCISKHFLVLGRADSVLGWSFNFFGFSLFFF